MNIDKNALAALLSLGDEEFSQKIGLITEKLGVDQRGVSPEKIRFFLRSMSENDLEKLVSSLGEDRAAEILRELKGGK